MIAENEAELNRAWTDLSKDPLINGDKLCLHSIFKDAWQESKELDYGSFGSSLPVAKPRTRSLSIMDTVTLRQTPNGAFVL